MGNNKVHWREKGNSLSLTRLANFSSKVLGSADSDDLLFLLRQGFGGQGECWLATSPGERPTSTFAKDRRFSSKRKFGSPACVTSRVLRDNLSRVQGSSAS